MRAWYAEVFALHFRSKRAGISAENNPRASGTTGGANNHVCRQLRPGILKTRVNGQYVNDHQGAVKVLSTTMLRSRGPFRDVDAQNVARSVDVDFRRWTACDRSL